MKDNILIKSIDRQSGTSSNFTIYSTLILEGTYILKYAVIPNTIFNVNEMNRRFTLLEGAMTYPILLAVGNYTPDTFVDMLATVLSSASGFATYEVTYDPVTFEITISETAFQLFRLDLTAGAQVRALLGFNVVETPLASSVSGSGVLNLGSPDSLGIQIQQSQTRGFENVATDCVGTLYVPLNNAFGRYQSLSSLDLPQYVKFSQRQRQLNIRLVDTSTNLEVDLNNSNFELLLSRV